ncbi:D-xylulose kinase, subgroup 1 [Haloferula helveola]|uniref:D-xylulose kinase, subgroup 1 n=1 Tax=Haloferula helveola TaxID=490095 RepID=A0ABN6H0B8_9BACT|nr:D-xylulose kinase, subgroup 1 [Haloferula helveola]
MHFLGIEIGHGLTRVAALELEAARVTATASAPLEWIEGLPEGYAEQDPARWIGAVDHAVREVLAQLGDAKASVAGIGVTAPAGGMVVLDGDDRIVRPAKRGNDRSARRQVEEIGRAFGGAPGLIEMTGNALSAGSLAAQALWLKEHEPKHFQRAARLLSAQDFIGYWLTGTNATSASTAAASGLFEVPNRTWCEPLTAFIGEGLGGLLPEVLEARQARGALRESLGDAWGLPKGVLVAAGSDGRAAGLFASGAALPEDLLADVSAEGALVGLAAEARVDFHGEGKVGCDLAGNGITRMDLENVIAAPELIRRQYGWTGAEFDHAITAAPAGADGLLFLPYLRGESVPRMPDGCGVLHGMTLDNFTPGNLARAAAEGVALGFGFAMSRLRDIGFEPTEVRLTRDVGPTSAQLLADVFGVPVVAVSGGGGALLGAAMQAAVVYFHDQGEELGFDEIAGYVVTADEASRRLPDAALHEFYGELLARQQYLAETLHAGGFL